MLISTRGRYALYVLIDLAHHENEGYVPLKEIAERQHISKKYMEGILKILVEHDLLEGSERERWWIPADKTHYRLYIRRNPQTDRGRSCFRFLHFLIYRSMQKYCHLSHTSGLAEAGFDHQ